VKNAGSPTRLRTGLGKSVRPSRNGAKCRFGDAATPAKVPTGERAFNRGSGPRIHRTTRGGYYFTGSRVSLESVVYQFLQGESPEGIVQAYPSLSLPQAYGGITYYLAHRAEIDEYLKRGEARFEELARGAREANPLFYARLEAAKHATPRA